MAQHYAHINEDNKVDAVIVIDTETITKNGGWYVNGVMKHLREWKETSPDTKDGVNEKGEIALRKNYAGKGFEYDPGLDAFIPPKEFDAWTLDTEKGKYVPPKEAPKDGKEYNWDDAKNDWVDVKAEKSDVIIEEEIKP
jgi:hypothetical protein